MPPRTSAVELLGVIVPAVLGVAALALYATLMLLLCFHAVPAENRDLVSGGMNLIGGSLVGCAFGFYFGASMHAKAATPAAAAAAAPAAAAATPPETPGATPADFHP